MATCVPKGKLFVILEYKLSFPSLVLTWILPPLPCRFDGKALEGEGQRALRSEVIAMMACLKTSTIPLNKGTMALMLKCLISKHCLK